MTEFERLLSEMVERQQKQTIAEMGGRDAWAYKLELMANGVSVRTVSREEAIKESAAD